MIKLFEVPYRLWRSRSQAKVMQSHPPLVELLVAKFRQCFMKSDRSSPTDEVKKREDLISALGIGLMVSIEISFMLAVGIHVCFTLTFFAFDFRFHRN